MVATTPVSQKVSIVTTAVVAITGDNAVRTDTLHTVLGASYVQTANRQRIDGLLSDFRFAAGSTPLAVPAGLQLGRPFSADVQAPNKHYVFRLPAENSACTDATLSSLQGMHEAWIPVPDTLALGLVWSDTLRTITCRDRIMLRVTAVRRFRVRRATVDSAGRVLLAIERTTSGKLAGAGEQFGEALGIAGESTGTLLYSFDTSEGRLLHADGNSVLTFALTSRRRSQTARQESQVKITWLP